jgi:hypothetical protein
MWTSKPKANEIRRINHEFEILLDAQLALTFLHQMRLTTTMMSILKMI